MDVDSKERRLSLERLDGRIAAHYPLAVGCYTFGLPPAASVAIGRYST